MKKLALFALIALTIVSLGLQPGGQAETSWKSRAVYDSLLSSDVPGAADTIKLIHWEASPGGRLCVQLVSYSVATSGAAPSVTFKWKLREKDGEYSWVTCGYAINGGAVGSPPTAISGSTTNLFYVGYFGAGLIVDVPTTLGTEIYMILTKNNWTTGSIDAWSYWKQD